MKRQSIRTDDSDDEWAEFLADLEKKILDGPEDPPPPPELIPGHYPWFPYWGGDDN